MNASLPLSLTSSLRHPLPSPEELRERLPLNEAVRHQVAAHRQAIRDILHGRDPRLLVIVGPCSLHDPDAALEYGQRLADLAERTRDSLLLVMRAYLEKPRTSIGWKGMLYDPRLDGSDDMQQGLVQSRRLLLDLLDLGLPLASELLQPLATDYFADLLGWAAIGARTSESQIHREMVSGLSLPVGFKNGTDGNLATAFDAMRSAAHSHTHMGIAENGRAALIQTPGNADTHLVLRGGKMGPNHDEPTITAAAERAKALGLNRAMMVDCSHANSGKDPSRQPEVLREALRQRSMGAEHLCGVMLESHLFEGSQPLSEDLRYGVSITDACLGWEHTEQALLEAATLYAIHEHHLLTAGCFV